MTGPVNDTARQRREMRSAARFFAVQALFQMESSDQTVDRVLREFEDHRFGERFEDYEMAEADLSLFRRLVTDAVNWQASIDQLTDRALVAKWPIARIDPTLRALFRAAGAELTQGDTPPRRVIADFVAVAEAFFPQGKEPKFVNAVLDHIARAAQPDAF